MVTSPDGAENRRQLTHDGFCVVEGILPREMLDRLLAASDQILAQQDDAHFATNRSSGSMVPVNQHPIMAELIAHPARWRAWPNSASTIRNGLPASSSASRHKVPSSGGIRTACSGATR